MVAMVTRFDSLRMVTARILVTDMWLVYCVMAFCVCCDLPVPCSALMIRLCVAATQ